MIGKLIADFHLNRLAGNDDDAKQNVKVLVERFQLNRLYLITALVSDDFSEVECKSYLTELGLSDYVDETKAP